MAAAALLAAVLPLAACSTPSHPAQAPYATPSAPASPAYAAPPAPLVPPTSADRRACAQFVNAWAGQASRARLSAWLSSHPAVKDKLLLAITAWIVGTRTAAQALDDCDSIGAGA
jgi:hypothetical protein